MIPYNTITAWSVSHPWPTREQVEQDLLLSKAICEIYNNETLAAELVFRGGTALNKMILKCPYRYSEDLDFVRSSTGGIGKILDELRTLGETMGYQVKIKLNVFPKVYWLTKAQTGVDLRLKIEINTFERSAALDPIIIKHTVKTDWYTGQANVKVIRVEEIAASKIRALYQRSKGRDLFDLWLLTTEVGVDPDIVLNAFPAYRPDGYTGKKAIENLEAKLRNTGFKSDLNNMISIRMSAYDPNEAAETIIREYLSKI